MKISDIVYGAWAIQPQMLTDIRDIYQARMRGEQIDLAAVKSALGRPLSGGQQRDYDVIDGVAVIPMQGVMAKKMNLMQDISGGVSSQLVGRDVDAALADPSVHSLILHVDGPGGTVDGTAELADKILLGRTRKPIVTLADGLMASAHYWAGSAAGEIYSTGKTTDVGSIGVVTAHRDVSQANAQAGHVIEEIYAGKYKRIASEHAPLSDEGRAYMQAQVDYLYGVFVDAVATHRGVSVSQVLSTMAGGQIFIGQQAIDAGLVDGFASLDELIEQLNDKRSSGTARAIVSTNRAGSAQQTPSASAGTKPTKGKTPMDITLESIATDHPELAQAFRDEGATAERERIQSIEALAMPGHEALISQLKFDGRTTGGDAAMQILQAEKGKRAQVKADLLADAPAPLEPAAHQGSDDIDADVAPAMTPKQMAAEACALVAQAKNNGRTLSVIDAMAQVKNGERA